MVRLGRPTRVWPACFFGLVLLSRTRRGHLVIQDRQITSADTEYNGKVNGLIGFRRRQKPNFLWQYKVRRGDQAGNHRLATSSLFHHARLRMIDRRT